MAEWYAFSESFYAMTIAGIIGMMMLVCRICYKCKFDNINICYGGLQCHRNVEAEEKIDIENGDEIPNPTVNLNIKKPT